VTLCQSFFTLLDLDESTRLIGSPQTLSNACNAFANLRLVFSESSVVARKKVL
jgi:hypothetical protein